MLGYLLTARKFFAADKPYSQRAVAESSGVHEDVVARWHRVPGFDEWFGDQMYAEADRMVALAAAAVARRVIRTGDASDFERLCRVRGMLPSGYVAPNEPSNVPGGVNVAHYTLNLLVPRPELPAPAHQVIDVRQ